MIVYIAGRVTGIPREQAREKFIKAEFILKRKGYTIINPVTLVNPSYPWQRAMRICLKKLLDADAIFLLSDWKQSKGAKVERWIAKLLGIKIMEEVV